jgi:assimilatory nitrate reductase catalytic subunit
MTETRTTCPYCGVGCGVIVSRDDSNGAVSLRGDPQHPANFGRLCSKGSALAETLSLDDRLLYPELHGERIGWDAALDHAAARFTQVIDEHGPEAVAFYVSGQLLTEDYYVANKLMKGYIGSANIDTNSRLCMASAVVGHKRAFGSDTVPVNYEDLELADLVVLVGSNLAWCHPVLFQRLAAAKAERPQLRVVVIDPRRTMTAQFADLHLPLAPGSDVALFNGLLAYLEADGRADAGFLGDHTSGAEAALKVAREAGIDAAVSATGLSRATLFDFYALFAHTEKVVTGFSQGVNQSSHGVDKVNAILNCHLYTGRIGKQGQGPFSITGQPNAMGGREVGGLANQLAAHMDIDNPTHRALVQDFWQSPAIAAKQGLKAVDLFQAVREGKVRAVWIAGTNPVDSMPDADAVRDALKACDFVVVSDVTRHTDTAVLAHLLLPAAAWGEKDGTVTNSERRVSRQRGFLPLPGEAKPDWWIFAEVARRMGWGAAFAYENAASIFAEHAALSGHNNAGSRDFDLSHLSGITPEAYDALAPLQWGPARFFGDGRFYTPDSRARLLPTVYVPPASQPDDRYPLILNTGRVRDQWHTMTRTAKTARLMSHIAEPFVELHPDDAAARGIAPASLVRLESERGHVIARALVTPEQQRGSVFVPLHWTDQLASRGRVDALIAPHRDALSGQPELKYTIAEAKPYQAAWYGFAVLAERPAVLKAEYWALAPAKAGWRVELADAALPDDWDAFARRLFAADDFTAGDDVEMLAYRDVAGGRHRFAAFKAGKLLGALFVAPEPVAVSRAWAAERLEEEAQDAAARLRLLAGRAGADRPERGAIVCACFEIGVNQIVAAIGQGCADVEAVGAALKAGTNCGSCRSEIRRLIDGTRIQKAG